jgi:hypothetical protein
VTAAGLNGGGWLVETRDGRRMMAVITAKVHTLKIPTLQVGDKVHVYPFPDDAEYCSIDLQWSPVVWVSRSKAERISAKSIRHKRSMSRKSLR